jgi:hypothetical protein
MNAANVMFHGVTATPQGWSPTVMDLITSSLAVSMTEAVPPISDDVWT